MFVQLTVMPVAFVNASSEALGGAGMARATLILTPLVADEAEVPPPEHAVPSRARPDSAPTTTEALDCRREAMGDASLSEDDPPLRAFGAVLNRRPMRDERAETQQMADGRS